jgi:methyl-accepting chemotaxis protein
LCVSKAVPEEAAGRTEALIRESLTQVEAAAMTGEQVAAVLRDVSVSGERVSAVVGEIRQAAVARSERVQEVSRSVGQVDGVTQTNAASSEEASSSAEALAGRTESLATMVRSFRIRAHREQASASEVAERVASAEGPVARA